MHENIEILTYMLRSSYDSHFNNNDLNYRIHFKMEMSSFKTLLPYMLIWWG